MSNLWIDLLAPSETKTEETRQAWTSLRGRQCGIGRHQLRVTVESVENHLDIHQLKTALQEVANQQR